MKALEKAIPKLWKRSVGKLENCKAIERVGGRVLEKAQGPVAESVLANKPLGQGNLECNLAQGLG